MIKNIHVVFCFCLFTGLIGSCSKEEENNDPPIYKFNLTADVNGEQISMKEGDFNAFNESWRALWVDTDKLMNAEGSLMRTDEFSNNSYMVIGFYTFWDDTLHTVSLEERFNSIELGSMNLASNKLKDDGVYIHYQDKNDVLWYSYLYDGQPNSNFEVTSYKSTSANKSYKFFTAEFNVNLYNMAGDTLSMTNATFSGYVVARE